jgi:hypothetical protein
LGLPTPIGKEAPRVLEAETPAIRRHIHWAGALKLREPMHMRRGHDENKYFTDTGNASSARNKLATDK